MEIFSSGALSHPMNILGLISTVGLYATSTYVYLKRRDNEAARTFALFTGLLGTWSLTSVLVSSLASSSLQYNFVYIRAFVLSFIAPVWILSCLQYIGRNVSNPLTKGLKLWLPFGALLVVAFTQELHGLFWGVMKVTISEGVPVYQVEPSLGGYLYYFALYLYAFWGMYVLYDSFKDRPDTYKKQIWLINSGIIFIITISVYAVFWPGRVYPAFQLSPHTTGFAFVFMGAAMFGYGFLDIEPIARSRVIENVHSAVFVLDPNDQLVDANEEAESLTQFSRADMVGMDADELFPDSNIINRFDRNTYTTETFTTFLNDEERSFRLQQSPVESPQGEYLGRAVIVDDVTEKQRKERELRRQNKRLEKLTSVVSHDLINPLNMSQGYVDMVKNDIRDDSVPDEQAVERIELGLERMETLIDDVLLLARQGESVENPGVVSLPELAREAVKTADVEENIELVVDEDVDIRGDRDRLQSVLENLFRNSVKHGGADRIAVTESADGFTVADNGSGIPSAEREEVFEYGVTTDEEGTGIGLAIVSEIADAHGWDVDIETSSKGGARFRFTGVKKED